MNNKDSVAPEFSQAAIERRLKFGIAMDQKDLALNPSNLEALAPFGTFVFQSRWLNMQSLECPSDLSLELRALPFVSHAYCKAYKSFGEAESPAAQNRALEATAKTIASEELLRQTAHLEAHEFQKRGLNGKGVRIAVLDIGFQHTDHLAELQHLKIIKAEISSLKDRENIRGFLMAPAF